MIRLWFLAFLATAALSAEAHAQRAGNWTGPSVGLQFGHLDSESRGSPSLKGRGGSVGFTANYNYDAGRYVFGGGVQFDGTDAELGATEIDDILRFRARAGVDAGPNWYYGTFGWARATIEDPASATSASDGYFFGLGYEVFLNPNVTAGAELLHHDFEDLDLSGLSAEATTLNLSVNFRF